MVFRRTNGARGLARGATRVVRLLRPQDFERESNFGRMGGRRRLRTLNGGRRRRKTSKQRREREREREPGGSSQSSCSVGRGIASLSNSTMKQKKAPFAFVPGSRLHDRAAKRAGSRSRISVVAKLSLRQLFDELFGYMVVI